MVKRELVLINSPDLQILRGKDMGGVSYLIIATAEEIAALDPHEVPIKRFPGLDVKGTGLPDLEALWAVLKGGPCDPEQPGFPAVGDESGKNGVWFFSCPVDLFEDLAALSSEGLDRAAVLWLRTEEVRRRWELDPLRGRLADLHQFAQIVLTTGKPVHLWESR
jgi:hypothetical protein